MIGVTGVQKLELPKDQLFQCMVNFEPLLILVVSHVVPQILGLHPVDVSRLEGEPSVIDN